MGQKPILNPLGPVPERGWPTSVEPVMKASIASVLIVLVCYGAQGVLAAKVSISTVQKTVDRIQVAEEALK